MNPYIKILLLGNYIWYLGEGLLGPIYVVFAQQLGGDILEVTGAFATYLIIMGIVTIMVGKFANKPQQATRLMLIGYALNTLATFGYLFVDTPMKLFVIQAILGIASALATPTWDVLFSRYMDKKTGGEEWGFSDGGPHIISGIALILGAIIMTKWGFASLFIIMGCLQLIATVVQAKIVFMKQEHKVII